MTPRSVAGIILAGGLSRRMGEDKFRKIVGGQPLLTHVVRRITPQVDALALNLNGDPPRWDHGGLPIIADTVPGYPGPLAGILAGMEWAAGLKPRKDFILTVPCDIPFMPADLRARLSTALGPENSVALAASKEKVHAVVGLWRVELAEALRHAILIDGVRKVADWARQCRPAIVDFPVTRLDPFFNINSPADICRAEQEAGSHPFASGEEVNRDRQPHLRKPRSR